jgi:hypothetical protein
MARANVCRVCRAILTSTDEERSPGACPYCGAARTLDHDPDNPYTPPRSSPAEWLGGVEVEAGEVVPPLLLGKLVLAARLFVGDLPLITALILTVWLPGNLLTNSVVDRIGGTVEQRIITSALMRIPIGIFLGPIYAAGLIHVLAGRMTGNRSSYRRAIRAGLSNWWRLFAARVVTSVLIFLGFLALIVPGILLSLRYSLIDPVVVLEKAGVRQSRLRSGELVRGKEIEIFSGVTLLTFLYIIVVMALQAFAESRPLVQALWVDTTLDCLNDLVPAVGTCFLFGYYWEGHVNHPVDDAPTIDKPSSSGFEEL